jgi:hypothetical protein
MATAQPSAISVPATSTSVTEAIARRPDEDAPGQRERMLAYVASVRVEHQLEPDAELRGRLRSASAEWLD